MSSFRGNRDSLSCLRRDHFEGPFHGTDVELPADRRRKTHLSRKWQTGQMRKVDVPNKKSEQTCFRSGRHFRGGFQRCKAMRGGVESNQDSAQRHLFCLSSSPALSRKARARSANSTFGYTERARIRRSTFPRPGRSSQSHPRLFLIVKS